MTATDRGQKGPQVERRANLSYDEFAEQYLYANRPVIVTDALRGWRAVERWTPQFFKQEFGDMRFTLTDDLKKKVYGEGSGPVEYEMAEFIDQVLQSTERNPAPYLRNKILNELFPSLKNDIEPLPPYIRPNWLPERYLVKRVREQLNRGAAIELYIGGAGASFPVLHYDGAATHAFLMQIYGRKQYIVYSPDQTRFLYPKAEKPNLSMLKDLDKPDLEKFPLFAQAVSSTFFLEPGELLFVPSLWWHTAKILTPSITVSINTVNGSNWGNLVNYVAERCPNPVVSVGSRVYLNVGGAWRSWRDRKWPRRARAGIAGPRILPQERVG